MTNEDFIRAHLLPSASDIARIRRIIRSNSEPPPDIAQALNNLDSEIARYDAEIARGLGDLPSLEQARESLQSYHDDCLSLLSPVRRLPLEILTEIFALLETEPRAGPLGYLSDVTTSSAISMLANSPLRSLARVCSRWHTAIMTTSTLWNRVTLVGVLWTRGSLLVDRMMVGLRDILERGGQAGLFVVVETGNYVPYAPALRLLAEHSHRWTRFWFRGSSVDLRALTSIQGKLPRLRTIRLSGALLPESSSIFSAAPQLEEGYFSCSPDCWDALTQLPLHQLRRAFLPNSVSYIPQSPSPGFTILGHLSAPLTLWLSFPEQLLSNSAAGVDAPHTTCSISSLYLKCSKEMTEIHNVSTISRALDSLTLPSLMSLHFKTAGADSVPLPLIGIMDPFSASPPDLRSEVISRPLTYGRSRLQHRNYWNV
ncbi:hypothetical protein R3P38DRAFT_2763163 [Favolaschia claudopus]|uniref:F-box domain-containing protein n=1 Tax=Favolaschia claudopus TaxID=2862362 RepID=A0AAW0DDV4_9AGAR